MYAPGSEVFSRKVFVGGVPSDIDEESLLSAFRRFGKLSADWPNRAEFRSASGGGGASGHGGGGVAAGSTPTCTLTGTSPNGGPAGTGGPTAPVTLNFAQSTTTTVQSSACSTTTATTTTTLTSAPAPTGGTGGGGGPLTKTRSGYVFIVYEKEQSVHALRQACIMEDDQYFMEILNVQQQPKLVQVSVF